MSKKPYAVVTGASSGIGFEIAKQLSKRGYRIVLVARREKKLEKVSQILGTESIIITADLSKREECVKLMEETRDLDIEVFVNNAGFGDCGRFYSTDISKELEMIDVNVTAVHVLTKLMLHRLKQRTSGGYILNVASSAGLFPAGPYMATYYASKAYVTSLTSAVARELKDEQSDIYVGALCPGPVDTHFNDVANVEFSLKGISAKKCAIYAVNQMFKRKTIIVPTLRMKMAIFAKRILPRETMVSITGRQQKKKRGY